MPSLDQNTISALKLDNAHIWGFYTLVVAVFIIGIGLVIGSKKKAAQCLPYFESDGTIHFEKSYDKGGTATDDATMVPFFFPMFWNSTSTQIMQVDENGKEDNALFNLMTKVRDMKYGGKVKDNGGVDVGGFSRFMGIYAYSLLSITSSIFGTVYQAVHSVHNMSDGLVLEVFVFLFATVAFGLAFVLIPLIMFFMTLYNTIYINVLLNNSVINDKIAEKMIANRDITDGDRIEIASSMYILNDSRDAITGIQCKQNFINYVSGYFLNVLNNDWTYILNTPKYNEWIDKERKTLWGALVWFYWAICGIFTLILYAFIYFIVFLCAIVYIVVVIMIAFFAAHIMSAVIAPPFVLFYAVYVCFMTVHFKRVKPKDKQNVIPFRGRFIPFRRKHS
jgi:hypothetical protein